MRFEVFSFNKDTRKWTPFSYVAADDSVAALKIVSYIHGNKKLAVREPNSSTLIEVKLSSIDASEVLSS
jgi:hypothetical protein